MVFITATENSDLKAEVRRGRERKGGEEGRYLFILPSLAPEGCQCMQNRMAKGAQVLQVEGVCFPTMGLGGAVGYTVQPET